jgi:hypothetical protein
MAEQSQKANSSLKTAFPHSFDGRHLDKNSRVFFAQFI